MGRAPDKQLNRYRGIASLADAIVAMTIGAMVLVAVLKVYHRAQNAAEGIISKLDESRLPDEVLQRIAEDLDDLANSDEENVKIFIESKYDWEGYSTARLVITKEFYNSENEAETLEKIVWQTAYDWESDANGMVLYRSRSGVGMEDKLLDESKEDWERELFVPICEGVTYFRVQVPIGKRIQDSWKRDSLPRGVLLTLSFAEPLETGGGALEIPEEEKIQRMVAIDRTRKIRFIYVPERYDKEKKEQEEGADEEGEEPEGEGEAEEELEEEDSDNADKEEKGSQLDKLIPEEFKDRLKGSEE